MTKRKPLYRDLDQRQHRPRRPKVKPLALLPNEAAETLRISRSTLDRLGVPCVRLGRRKVVYPTHLLRRWLSEQAAPQAGSSNGVMDQHEATEDHDDEHLDH